MFNYILRIYYAILGRVMISDYKHNQTHVEYLIEVNAKLDKRICMLQSQLADLKRQNEDLYWENSKLHRKQPRVRINSGDIKIPKKGHGYDNNR